MEALQASYAEFKAAGAELVAITPTRPEFARQVANKHQLDFPILLDPGNRLARRFGLVFALPPELRQVYLGFGIDLERCNGDDSWELPMPARYLIDSHGVVRAAAVNADYTRRPEPEETLAALLALAATGP